MFVDRNVETWHNERVGQSEVFPGVCLCPIWVLCDEVERLDDGKVDAGRRDAPLVVPCFYSIENMSCQTGATIRAARVERE